MITIPLVIDIKKTGQSRFIFTNTFRFAREAAFFSPQEKPGILREKLGYPVSPSSLEIHRVIDVFVETRQLLVENVLRRLQLDLKQFLHLLSRAAIERVEFP